MDTLFELLKYIVPALIVFATAYFMIKSFLDNEQKKRMIELRLNNQKTVTPLKLQAYERLILFMERISPDTLVVRTQASSFNVRQYQEALMMTVRAEYEHNLTQQVYVSGETWQAIKAAKESIMKLINITASKLPGDASSTELSKKIIESVIAVGKSPTETAIKIIKKEANQYF